MVAVVNKELLSWYLITLKLKEKVEAGIVFSSSSHLYNPLPPLLQQHTVNNVLVVDDEQKHNKPPPPVADSEWVVSIRDKLDQACQDDVSTTCAKLCIYTTPIYILRDNFFMSQQLLNLSHRLYVTVSVSRKISRVIGVAKSLRDNSKK
ncbi:unnamed protein product [Rhodiola kirilowii]